MYNDRFQLGKEPLSWRLYSQMERKSGTVLKRALAYTLQALRPVRPLPHMNFHLPPPKEAWAAAGMVIN